MNSNTKDNWPGDQNCDVSSNSVLLLEKVICETYTAFINFDPIV